MSFPNTDAPALLPTLSRGKHRRPQKGACFMEFASYLAGERWSDHPRCTHPLLASLARVVNDTISDEYRTRLARLIPSVVGLNDDDLHLDALVVRRAAATGLPVVSADRQRVLAVAAYASERVLAELDGTPTHAISKLTREALDDAPDAAAWARQFGTDIPPTPRGFRRHAGPTAVRCAVIGIAQACVPDPHQILHDLLAHAIEDCLEWTRRQRTDVPETDPVRWAEACQLTGARP
jgi:hypothetical protein